MRTVDQEAIGQLASRTLQIYAIRKKHLFVSNEEPNIHSVVINSSINHDVRRTISSKNIPNNPGSCQIVQPVRHFKGCNSQFCVPLLFQVVLVSWTCFSVWHSIFYFLPFKGNLVSAEELNYFIWVSMHLALNVLFRDTLQVELKCWFSRIGYKPE